ncbi:Uncharacterised protein [Vibrio cholerae]|nr:Uncharacterised protein [Vibrio cholerae]
MGTNGLRRSQVHNMLRCANSVIKAINRRCVVLASP